MAAKNYLMHTNLSTNGANARFVDADLTLGSNATIYWGESSFADVCSSCATLSDLQHKVHSMLGVPVSMFSMFNREQGVPTTCTIFMHRSSHRVLGQEELIYRNGWPQVVIAMSATSS